MLKKKKKKPLERICKNCLLFNKAKSECRVVIIYEGEKVHLPVEPQDACFFEDKFQGNEDFAGDIKEIKMWVEDPETGKPVAGNGVVKIETPIDTTLHQPEVFWEKKPKK